ncbi:unnamed protein product [Musa acuminata subsp. malaccensis]|uniref:(wild Malaysian banana) hypothetical protein n=1 Tax=Musa acuminata subsp. malaccensis TaxID=214687 RepID=A0A804IBN7_MUSAM|nr:PREDICTED: uncharacterized protein LOC103973149 [Musa acuminata subsp. malaccensis]CAG1850054.1 unnamed protein product [Musa acuminata subsp. malaccensis]
MEQAGIIQALPITPMKEKESQRRKMSTDASISPRGPASSSRCTRSQAAADWTTYELLVLVNETAAMDEDWLRALSSYQKWKMISDNCVALDVIRSSYQCKRRWESLLAGYRKIREWESRHGEGSYWSLDSEEKHNLGLPTSFDPEIFGSMDTIIKPHEDQAWWGDVDSENLMDTAGGSEDLIVTMEAGMLDANGAQGSKENNAEDETQKKREKARDMASKLQDNARRIHAILRGELEAADIEFTRRQADQLIEALRELVGPLNQFTELIRAGNFGGIRLI